MIVVEMVQDVFMVIGVKSKGGIIMGGIVWKIESREKGVAKVELVKVVRTSFSKVAVKSIIDGYEYQYNKNYFLRNRKEATQEDISRYTFKLN